MYSVVMMMALSGSPAVPDFGHRNRCHGGGHGCSGYSGCSGGGCCGGHPAPGGCCGGMGTYGTPAVPKGEQVPAPKKTQAPATIIVQLPADATLTFNGRPTRATSARRSFITPPLQPGQVYRYELNAEIVRDGQRQVVTRQIIVRAGQNTPVALEFGNSTPVSSRPQLVSRPD